MNNEDQAELQILKRRQEALQREVEALGTRIESLSARSQSSPSNEKVVESATPPVIPSLPKEVVAKVVPAPPPIPVVPPRAAAPIIAPVILTANKTPNKDSLEMRIGKYWLVRIGIVVVLTSLVFAANLVYKDYIGKLGAPGKIALLYAASVTLLGAGAWLQRKGQKEALKNYAQVLFAGGLAAVYFTTYAGHYIEQLRVISSPLLAGGLLMGWAGYIAWIADRKKSEVLALFAIGLAYYTSAITNIGLFTLYSNVLLTVTAVFFLVRNRWATLSFVSLAATYGGFVFWRFYNGGEFLWDLRADNLVKGNLFLTCYWVLFTAAVFLSRGKDSLHGNRPAFLTLNNGAFFGLVMLSMARVHSGSFWKLALGFGLVLLALAALARSIFKEEPLVKNAYLTQGLLLVTVGLIAYFSGLKLALILAAESVALLVLGQQLKNQVMLAGSFVTAALAFVWTKMGMDSSPEVYSGVAVGALLAFNAFWVNRFGASCEIEAVAPKPVDALNPIAAFFSILALLAWLVTDWATAHREWFASILAIQSAVLVASFYVLKMRELTLFGQGYLLIAQILWLFNTLGKFEPPKWWHPLILIVVTLASSHWWQKQTVLTSKSAIAKALQAVYALAIIALLFAWLHPNFKPDVWLAFSAVLGLGITFYGMATRAWLLAECGQIFLFVSMLEFVTQLLGGKPGWYLAVMPIAVLVSTAWLVNAYLAQRLPDNAKGGWLPLMSLLYLGTATVMSLWWVYEYILDREQVWVLAAVGAAVFLLAGWRRKTAPLPFSGVFFASSLGAFLLLPLHDIESIYWPNFAAILLLPALQRLAKALPERYQIQIPWQNIMIVAGVLSLWLFCSRWVVLVSGQSVLMTAAWAGLAFVVFVTGFLIRERVYRWLGLAILAGALGRVIVLDVWRLETIYRILSFLALGLVLLALGFIYTKYQEKIKEWL